MKTFEQLYKMVNKSVLNFRSDFKIDEKIINDNSGLPFIHITRESGTRIIIFNKFNYFPEGKEMKWLNDDKMTLYYSLSPDMGMPKEITYFNGNKLTKIKKQKAIELFESYYRSIVFEYQNKQLEIIKLQS